MVKQYLFLLLLLLTAVAPLTAMDEEDDGRSDSKTTTQAGEGRSSQDGSDQAAAQRTVNTGLTDNSNASSPTSAQPSTGLDTSQDSKKSSRMSSREISSASSPLASSARSRTSSDPEENDASTSAQKDPQWQRYQSIQHVQSSLEHFTEQQQRYTAALTEADKYLGTSSIWKRPISLMQKMVCLPSSRVRTEARLHEAVQGVEGASAQLSEARERMGLADVDEKSLHNEASYSEKAITLGDHSIPEEGSFRFGELLKKQIETADTLYFLGELKAANKSLTDPFGSMEHDFGRSDFELERPGHAKEILCPPNASLKEPSKEGRHQAITQFKEFVGPNEALQIAVASAMHQGIFSDITKMEAAAPLAFAAGEEVPYVAQGLPHLFTISTESQKIRAGKDTLPEEKVYTLHEDSSSPKKFTLTAIRSLKQERTETTTGKKFTYQEQNCFVKTIEDNPHYDPEKEISLENSPVLFKCVGGSVTHHITLDQNQWRDVDALEPSQKQAVEEYGNAYYDYDAARQEHDATLQKIARHPSSSSGSLERSEAENKVNASRNRFARATAVLQNDPDPLVRSFLIENTNEASEGRVTFSTLDGDKTFPEKGSFIGGRVLQREVTEDIRAVLLPIFRGENTEPFDSTLKRDLSGPEKDTATGREFYFRIQDSGEEPRTLRLAPNDEFDGEESKDHDEEDVRLKNSVNRSVENLDNFIGDADLFKAIASTMHQGVFSTEESMLLRVRPISGEGSYSSNELVLIHDTSLFSNRVSAHDTAYLNLEKRESAQGPLFVLSVDHKVVQELRTSFEQGEGGSVINYERESRFIYTFEKNPAFMEGEEITINNLPVRVRCRFISINHQMPMQEGR